MVGEGAAENILQNPLRFSCNSRNQYFRSNFCEMYQKLNKLEHLSKCLYKIINKSLFLFWKYRGSSTSDKYNYFKENQYDF